MFTRSVHSLLAFELTLQAFPRLLFSFFAILYTPTFPNLYKLVSSKFSFLFLKGKIILFAFLFVSPDHAFHLFTKGLDDVSETEIGVILFSQL